MTWQPRGNILSDLPQHLTLHAFYRLRVSSRAHGLLVVRILLDAISQCKRFRCFPLPLFGVRGMALPVGTSSSQAKESDTVKPGCVALEMKGCQSDIAFRVFQL